MHGSCQFATVRSLRGYAHLGILIYSKRTLKVCPHLVTHSLQVAVIFVALMAVPWLLTVITFGIASFNALGSTVYVPRDNSVSYPFWMVSLCGPLLMVSAFLHAALWRPLSTYCGAVVSSIATCGGHGVVCSWMRRTCK